MISRSRCTHGSGYYVKAVATYEQHYDWNHIASFASDINWIRGGEVMYCSDCNARLGRSDWKEQVARRYRTE